MSDAVVVGVVAGIPALIGAAGGLYAVLAKSRRDDFEKAFQSIRLQLRECRERDERSQRRQVRQGAQLAWYAAACERSFSWIEHTQPHLERAGIPHPKFERPTMPAALASMVDTDTHVSLPDLDGEPSPVSATEETT